MATAPVFRQDEMTVNVLEEMDKLRTFQETTKRKRFPGTQQWSKCACGTVHPNVKSFTPDGSSCYFYWHLADMFPKVSMRTIFHAEVKFQKMDYSNKGELDLDSLRRFIKELDNHSGAISDRTINSTFLKMDTDRNSHLDFGEVLAVIADILENSTAMMEGPVQSTCSVQ